MVNASLNWASIVGIVLAVGGALLYFMRTFKPALARDYDVFFAAIGLLCGGILFFQGWRLDPILQFGQFLLAGTTVFFAYESVRLRGVATEQARRSSYFDDEPAVPASPFSGGGLRGGWDENYDRFDEPQPLRRRVSAGDQDGSRDRPEEDFYRPRRTSRAAIPEEAESRRVNGPPEDESWSTAESERARRMRRFGNQDDDPRSRSSFGDRRSSRQDLRRGSRPTASRSMASTSRPSQENNQTQSSARSTAGSRSMQPNDRPGIPQGSPIRPEAEDAAFSPSRRQVGETRARGNAAPNPMTSSSERQSPRSSRPKDNNSRFDD